MARLITVVLASLRRVAIIVGRSSKTCQPHVCLLVLSLLVNVNVLLFLFLVFKRVRRFHTVGNRSLRMVPRVRSLVSCSDLGSDGSLYAFARLLLEFVV